MKLAILIGLTAPSCYAYASIVAFVLRMIHGMYPINSIFVGC